jgi:hypothetical protein
MQEIPRAWRVRLASHPRMLADRDDGLRFVQILLSLSVQNTSMDWIQYLPGLIMVIGVIVLLPLSKRAAINLQHRLSEWAKSERVTIISQRGARFYEGPGAWLRNENQNMYRLEVRDAKGQVHLAWITFGNDLLSSEINPEISEVNWG